MERSQDVACKFFPNVIRKPVLRGTESNYRGNVEDRTIEGSWKSRVRRVHTGNSQHISFEDEKKKKQQWEGNENRLKHLPCFQNASSHTFVQPCILRFCVSFLQAEKNASGESGGHKKKSREETREKVKQSTKFKVTSSRLIRFGTRLKVKFVSSSFRWLRNASFYAPNQQQTAGPKRGQYIFTFIASGFLLCCLMLLSQFAAWNKKKKLPRDISLHNNKKVRNEKSSASLLLHRYRNHELYNE